MKAKQIEQLIKDLDTFRENCLIGIGSELLTELRDYSESRRDYDEVIYEICENWVDSPYDHKTLERFALENIDAMNDVIKNGYYDVVDYDFYKHIESAELYKYNENADVCREGLQKAYCYDIVMDYLKDRLGNLRKFHDEDTETEIEMNEYDVEELIEEFLEDDPYSDDSLAKAKESLLNFMFEE